MGVIVSSMPEKKIKMVLIVDDNRDAADTLAMLIKSEGHTVETAYDSEAGLKLARRLMPDIIFHDIGMPIVDGYMAARSLRQDPKFNKTVLIALTAYDATQDRRRASMAGFDLHMTKALDFDDLKLALSKTRQP
jgi:CheY-like chemotaxis protein